MARTDKQLSYEERYKQKMDKYKEAYKVRTDFASKFKLKPEKTKGYYLTGEIVANGEEKKPTTETSDGTPAGTVPGDGNKEKAWNFFAGKGFTNAAVAGIMGNLNQESKFSTTIVNSSSGATGLGQWLGGRLSGLKKFGGDKWTDMSVQLEWIWKELNGADPTTKSKLNNLYGGIEKLKTSTDYKWVVRAYEDSFERSGGSAINLREQYAKEFLDKYGGGKGTGTASTIQESGNDNKNEDSETTAKSLSVKFQVTRDIKSKATEDTTDTSMFVPTPTPYDNRPSMLSHIGASNSVMFKPPSTNRNGYARTRLEDARLSQWSGWAPLNGQDFIHLAGPQENFYAPEANKAFQLLRKGLKRDKLKIIHGFEPSKQSTYIGSHHVGMAMDIYVDNIQDALYVADTAWTLGFRAIAIGGSELSTNKPGFVHVDCGPKAFWPLNHHDVYKGPNTFRIIER